ncbi:MAG: DUF192 domain-containing protein [Planctomycetes bacterium]|nr:DUF192 domain-containing protein [Planctomycetota bacterium]
MRWILLGAMFLVGCPSPAPVEIPTQDPAVKLKAEEILVQWLPADPARRYPLAEHEKLDRGILAGWPHDRILHFFNESRAAAEVVFLSEDGVVLQTGRLEAESDAGITSVQPARYALFLPAGWTARRAVVPGDRAGLSRSIKGAQPMPEARVDDVPVRVELAFRDWERRRGLSHRRAISPDEGMLFIYAEPGEKSFWMRHCHFGLDIAFFGPDRKLLNVVSMDPYPDPAVDHGDRARSEGKAKFVLEVPQGWFARHHLERGGLALRLSESIDPFVELAQ